MGIFDFFKSKKPASEPKKIELAEVAEFILKEKNKTREAESASIQLIQENIKKFVNELEPEISAINKIDLKDRKVEEKIKLIVLDNAKIFADYLEKLKNKLRNLQTQSLTELIKAINENFQEFKKKSFMSLEKARYLIGKELEAVMKSIDSFYKNMNEVLKNNQKLIETSGIITRADSIYNEIQETLEIGSEIKESSKNIIQALTEFKKQVENLENKINNVKQSREYSEKLKKQQDYENQKTELKKELVNLRALIDFKELAKIHHSIPRNMTLIQEYSNNIQDAFEKDKGESILGLITKNKNEISEQISKILQKEKQISEFIPEKDDILEIKKEISVFKSKITELDDEELRLDKRDSQLKEKMTLLKEQLKNELDKLGLTLQ